MQILKYKSEYSLSSLWEVSSLNLDPFNENSESVDLILTPPPHLYSTPAHAR